ncbi:MAG: prepilin-type N-terminal cleavage/methylation domain-containing protein [Legionella sp.]|nr:prepilin-type N-terminal cleavage/methylation domain-containing protein [Legionella sp.]
MTQHGFSLMEVLASMTLVALVIFFILQMHTQYTQLMLKIIRREQVSSQINLMYERDSLKRSVVKDMD